MKIACHKINKAKVYKIQNKLALMLLALTLIVCFISFYSVFLIIS